MKIINKSLIYTLLLTLTLVFTSCVSSKKYKSLQSKLDETEMSLKQKLLQLDKCQKEAKAAQDKCSQDLANATKERDMLRNKASDLEKELNFTKRTNETLMNHLSDLSNLTKAESENLQKTLEQISEQRKYIKQLNTGIRKRDSVSLALVTNLKRSLADVNDEDVQIDVRKGVVYISISDKLLFNSGSSVISSKAKKVLAKVAKVLNDHNEFEVMVEGHTDNVPISNDCVKDNWDLSAKRATAVVRTLQRQYNVAPARMIAAGRSEYVPKASNDTASGRKLNRRTEIVITPTIAEYFNLMKPTK